MPSKVYFAGSIRGGREDAALYHELISHIKETDIVLTEQVGDLSKSVTEQTEDREKTIYEQDTAWLRECDLVIAECTRPSLGVGYELAYAEAHGRPVYVFYRRSVTQLSAMIRGNTYFSIIPYENKEELFAETDRILAAYRK